MVQMKLLFIVFKLKLPNKNWVIFFTKNRQRFPVDLTEYLLNFGFKVLVKGYNNEKRGDYD